jgi:hypothetical protein
VPSSARKDDVVETLGERIAFRLAKSGRARSHPSLGLLTPTDVHQELVEQHVAARAMVLTAAYAPHRERFPAGLPNRRRFQ